MRLNHRIIFVIVIILSLTATANAQNMTSARAVALGSAYTSLATGVDAAKYNPANLGLESHRKNNIELVGIGANIKNNSFTLDDYNTYSGAFLTDADKDYILSRIPKEGLKVSADAEASVFSMSSGSYALTASGFGLVEVNMNKDILDLILNGNSFAETIDLSGTYSEALAYGKASLSYGLPIYKAGDRKLAVGATFSYIYGIGVEKVVEMEGLTTLYSTGFQGEGKIKLLTATGGSGYAVDLGAALQLSENYTVGARIKNFMSHLTWNKDTEEHGYIFSFDTMTIDNMNEDYIISEDYSKPAENFTTKLPASLNVGIAKTTGNFIWAFDWEQGFRTKIGSSTKPRVSAGVEWNLIRIIPLRMGYSTGGYKSSSFSFGSGFNFPVLHIDYAVVTGNSFSGNSSKGANFAITAGINF